MTMLFIRINQQSREYLGFETGSDSHKEQHFDEHGKRTVHTVINRNFKWTTDLKQATLWPDAMGQVVFNNRNLISEPGYEYQVLNLQTSEEKPATDLEGHSIDIQPVDDGENFEIPDLKDDDLINLMCTSTTKYDELKKYNPNYSVETALYINRDLFDQHRLQIKIPVGQADSILCATIKGSEVLVLGKRKVKLVAKAL